jgi:hypothetical protein
MTGTEILTTVAQLGVAITGFTGIAIAFNRHPGRLGEFEAFRVSILFSNSLAGVFLALLPFAFFYLGWSEQQIWRTLSGAFAIFELIFLTTHFPPARRFSREYPESFNFKLLMLVTIGHVLNGIAQTCNALGITKAAGLPVFIFGLLWVLFHSAFQFGRILFVQPEPRGAMPTPNDPVMQKGE